MFFRVVCLNNESNFYGTIQRSSDITVNGIYESISNTCNSEKREFSNHLKCNLTGYVSDGNQMFSDEGGLFSKICRQFNFFNPLMLYGINY